MVGEETEIKEKEKDGGKKRVREELKEGDEAGPGVRRVGWADGVLGEILGKGEQEKVLGRSEGSPRGKTRGSWGLPAPCRPLPGLHRLAKAESGRRRRRGKCSQAGRWEGPRPRGKPGRGQETGREGRAGCKPRWVGEVGRRTPISIASGQNPWGLRVESGE